MEATTSILIATENMFAAPQLTENSNKPMIVYNINVNVVCPGTVWTPMMQGLSEYFGMEEEEAKEAFLAGQSFKDREITMEDIGRTVAWLASDENSILTGTVITVDAGWTCRAP